VLNPSESAQTQRKSVSVTQSQLGRRLTSFIAESRALAAATADPSNVSLNLCSEPTDAKVSANTFVQSTPPATSGLIESMNWSWVLDESSPFQMGNKPGSSKRGLAPRRVMAS